MGKKKYFKKLNCSAFKDMTFNFTSDEDDTDEESEPEPTPKPRRLFANRDRIRLRPSIITKNIREIVSSTPAHSAKKTFNKSLFISPINNATEKKLTRRSISLQQEAASSSSTSFSKNKASNEAHEDDKNIEASKSPAKSTHKVTNDKIRCIFPTNDSNIITNHDDSNLLAETLPSDSENLENTQEAMPEKAGLMVSVNKTLTNSRPEKLMSASAQTNFSCSPIKKKFRSVVTQTAFNKGTQVTDSLEKSSSKSTGYKKYSSRKKKQISNRNKSKVRNNKVHDRRDDSSSSEDEITLHNVNGSILKKAVSVGVNTSEMDVNDIAKSPETGDQHNTTKMNEKQEGDNWLDLLLAENLMRDSEVSEVSSNKVSSGNTSSSMISDKVIIGDWQSRIQPTEPMNRNRRAEQNISDAEKDSNKTNNNREMNEIATNTGYKENVRLSRQRLKRNKRKAVPDVEPKSFPRTRQSMKNAIEDPTDSNNYVSRAIVDAETNNTSKNATDVSNKEISKIPDRTRKLKDKKIIADIAPSEQNDPGDIMDVELQSASNADVSVGNRSKLNEKTPASSRNSLQNKSKLFVQQQANHTLTTRINDIFDNNVPEPQLANDVNLSIMETRSKRNNRVESSSGIQDVSNRQDFKDPKTISRTRNKKKNPQVVGPSEQNVEQHEPEDVMDVKLQSTSNANVSVGNRSNLNEKSQASSRNSLRNKSKLLIQQQANHTITTRVNDISDNNLPEPQLASDENLSIMETRSKKNNRVESSSGMQDVSNRQDFKIPKPISSTRNKKKNPEVVASSEQSVAQHDPEEMMDVELQSSSNTNISDGSRSNLNTKSQASSRNSLQNKSFTRQQANHTKSTELQSDSNENLSRAISIVESRVKGNNKKVETRSGMQDVTNRQDFEIPKLIPRKRNRKRNPETVVSVCSDSSADGVRRSTRTRKERVLRPSPGYVVVKRKLAEYTYSSNLDPSTLYRHQEDNSSKKSASIKQKESMANSRLNSKTSSRNNAKRIRTKRVNTKIALRNNQNDESISDSEDISSKDVQGAQGPNQCLHDEESVQVGTPDVEDVFNEIQNNHENSRWTPRVMLQRLDKTQLDPSSSEVETNSEYILRDYFYFPQNNKVCKMDWCSIVPRFGRMRQNDCVRMAIGPKSSYVGFQTGIMEILPGKCKPRDLTKKYSLIFTVTDGEAIFEVHDSYNIAKRSSIIHVPLGAYYSIKNQSQTKCVTIHYIQIKPP